MQYAILHNLPGTVGSGKETGKWILKSGFWESDLELACKSIVLSSNFAAWPVPSLFPRPPLSFSSLTVQGNSGSDKSRAKA